MHIQTVHVVYFSSLAQHAVLPLTNWWLLIYFFSVLCQGLSGWTFLPQARSVFFAFTLLLTCTSTTVTLQARAFWIALHRVSTSSQNTAIMLLAVMVTFVTLISQVPTGHNPQKPICHLWEVAVTYWASVTYQALSFVLFTFVFPLNLHNSPMISF